MLKKITTALFFIGISSQLFAQDVNIPISLGDPGVLGVKIKNNFPNYTGKFVRGFTLSNQDGASDFIGLWAFGDVVNGVSTLGYGLIGNNVANPMMTFLPGGNIGIGTTNPSAKLAVEGNIKAREIKVESTVWPDYVFEKSYQLLTLEETDKYIKENGHLPGIPSAVEVKKNGIELGDMNAKLLQKIEELTIHLFVKDKQMNEMKAMNEAYERRLQALEKK